MKIFGLGIPEWLIVLYVVAPFVIAIGIAAAANRRALEALKLQVNSGTDNCSARTKDACPSPVNGAPISSGRCLSTQSANNLSLPVDVKGAGDGGRGGVAPSSSLPRVIDSLPAIKGWETSVGFSVLGVVASMASTLLLSLVNTMIALGVLFLFADVLASVAGEFVGALAPFLNVVVWNTICIVYAAVFYPSYFKEAPVLKSGKAISFLNLMIGGIIFGALWNANLTKSRRSGEPHRGVSFAVFIASSVLVLLSLVLAPLLVLFLV